MLSETTRYIAGKAALNLPAPEGTSGDWHWATVLYRSTGEPKQLGELPMAGDGEF